MKHANKEGLGGGVGNPVGINKSGRLGSQKCKDDAQKQVKSTQRTAWYKRHVHRSYVKEHLPKAQSCGLHF